MEQEFQNKLKACCAMARTYLAELKTHPTDSQDPVDTIKMKDTMAKLGKVIANDATKLSIACKPPRKPEDGIHAINEISNTFYRFIGFYHTIPESCGQTYKAAYANVIQDALHGLMALCASFMTKEDQAAEQTKSFMVPTAALWETCENLEKTLPKDNREAVLKRWKSLKETLADAKSEAHEVVDEAGFDDQVLEGDALETAKTCAKLADLVVLVFQKIERRCIAQGSIDWLDRACHAAETLVDENDTLVSQVYDEPSAEEMKAAIRTYVDHALALVKIAQEVAQGEHATWFEMCAKKYTETANR